MTSLASQPYRNARQLAWNADGLSANALLPSSDKLPINAQRLRLF
jgi:hypothetical protein